MCHPLYCYFALMLIVGTQSVLAATDEPATPVTVVEVVSQQLHAEVPLSGTAEALRASAISARVEGLIAAVLVNEGDWVKAGQKILTLDQALVRFEVAAAQARLNEAIARHKDAKRLRDEYQSLLSRKAVAATTLASAAANEEAARAAVSRQRAELQQLQERLARHTLQAPFAGLVAQKHVEAGQWVAADEAVIKLVALDRIRIRASLPQRYYAQLAPKAQARIVFDALPEQPFFGEITALVAMGDQNTRSFPLLIELDNNQHTIAPGMSARIFVKLRDSESHALLIPRDAVVLKPDGSRIVWRIAEQETELRAHSVELFTGREQGKLVEVLNSPLQLGDRVVLLGNENLRANQRVRLSEVQP